MSAFVIDRFRQTKLFTTCTVLFSGASLKYVEPRGTGVSKAEMEALQEFYTTSKNTFLNDSSGQLQGLAEKKSGRLGAFKYFVFGQHNSKIRRLLVDEMKRIPVVIGQDDPIMRFDKVMKFIPSAARKRLIDTIPG